MEEVKTEITFNDFPYVCRVCLSREHLQCFDNYNNLLILFEDITNIQVNQEVDLPRNVCAMCINQLENISAFINVSKTTDVNLKEIYNKLSEETSLDSEITDSQLYFHESEEELKIKCEDNADNLKYEAVSKSNQKTSRGSKKSQSLKCDICGEYFSTKGKLMKHWTENASCAVKEFKCVHCEKAFFTKFKLKIHMRSHTKETPFQCNICSKKFRHSSNLKRHDDTVHKKLRPYKCDVCGKEYSRLASKNEHMYSHSEEYRYICVFCGKPFRTYSSHFYHVQSHKTSNDGLLKSFDEKGSELSCKICDKTFYSKPSMVQHMQLHGERKFLCTVCGKSFVWKRQLENHTMLHTGEKPHVCNYCGKSFRLMSGYKSHILVHTGEKPYKCQLCNKSFVQSVHLRKHVRCHTGEKPYPCSFCGKKFAEKCNLRVHVRIHTGETPYRCSICDVGFYDSSNLKKHEKGHFAVGKVKRGMIN